ncbi:hypothetical protein ATKI12_4159 [Kitasatospora sp. Ki12]|nr:hypothetical protein [Kitasatospora xanthocidica]GHF38188.1 hypothetical protein GCM10018790_14860 [Kitasatospora xanthocidica]
MVKKIAVLVGDVDAAVAHTAHPAAPHGSCAYAGRSGEGADIGPS